MNLDSSIVFESLGTNFYITEQPENQASTGTKVWETGKILCKYLERNRKKYQFEGKKVLEIGAGCGLTGIVVSSWGAHVTVTDQDAVMYLMKQNISSNQASVTGSIQPKVLDWGVTPISQFSPPYDFVIGSDVVYQLQAVEPLVEVLNAMTSRKTTCLISLEERDKQVLETFLEKSGQYFNVTRIPRSKQHPDFNSEFCIIYNLQKK